MPSRLMVHPQCTLISKKRLSLPLNIRMNGQSTCMDFALEITFIQYNNIYSYTYRNQHKHKSQRIDTNFVRSLCRDMMVYITFTERDYVLHVIYAHYYAFLSLKPKGMDKVLDINYLQYETSIYKYIPKSQHITTTTINDETDISKYWSQILCLHI